jgi:hypothetical protein
VLVSDIRYPRTATRHRKGDAAPVIVPQYWAEARVRQRGGGKQVSVRRFGWSDASEADAQAMAEARARDDLQRIVAGASLQRREPRVAYNGADGVPIREEVLARHDDVVITRNAYGARCLNTPNVLIADVDLPLRPRGGLVVLVAGALLVLTAAVAWSTSSWQLLLFGMVGTVLLAPMLARLAHRLRMSLLGGPATLARRRIERFAARHPSWHLRLYRTPAGFRVLALHRLFAPSDPEVDACFGALAVDSLYARMCRNQQCFRARLTAKPWRIGMPDRMRPRPGVWPVAAERRAAREAWIADYERRAEGHAACQFVARFGSGTVHPAALTVQRLHDDACRAGTTLPLA